MYANKVETKEKIKIAWDKKLTATYMSNIASGRRYWNSFQKKKNCVQNLRLFFVTTLIFNFLTGKQFCLLKSPQGGLLIINTLKGRGLIWEGELINLAKTMVSVLHKELAYKREKPRIINKSELPVGEWTILDRPTRRFTVLIDQYSLSFIN